MLGLGEEEIEFTTFQPPACPSEKLEEAAFDAASTLSEALGDQVCRVCRTKARASSRTAFCNACRKDVDAVFASFKKHNRVAEWKEVLKGPDDEFQKVMTETKGLLARADGKVGKGFRKNTFDVAKYLEQRRSFTGTSKGIRYKYLTFKKFVQWFMTEEGVDQATAEQEWHTRMLHPTTIHEKDENNQQMIAVVDERYLDIGEGIVNENIVQQSTKDIRKPSDERVEAMRRNLSSRLSTAGVSVDDAITSAVSQTSLVGKFDHASDLILDETPQKKKAKDDPELLEGSGSKKRKTFDVDLALSAARQAALEQVLDLRKIAQDAIGTTLAAVEDLAEGLSTSPQCHKEDQYKSFVALCTLRWKALQIASGADKAPPALWFAQAVFDRTTMQALTDFPYSATETQQSLKQFADDLRAEDWGTPCPSFHLLLSLPTLEKHAKNLGAGCTLEEDVADARSGFGVHVERFRGLVTSLTRAARQLQQTKTAKESKFKQECKRQLDAAEKLLKKKEEQDRRQAMAAAAAKTPASTPKAKANPNKKLPLVPCVFSLDLEHHPEIPQYDGTDPTFCDTANYDQPFICVDCDWIAELLPQDNHLKVASQMFMAGFLGSAPAQTTGRAHGVITLTKTTEKAIQRILPPAPLKDLKVARYTTALNCVHFFGYTHSMTHIGHETNALPSLRITLRGDRRVLLTPLRELVRWMNDDKITLQHVVDLFTADITQEKLESMLKSGVPLLTATLSSKSLIYVPAGYIVMEQCRNGGESSGLRLSVLPSEWPAASQQPHNLSLCRMQ